MFRFLLSLYIVVIILSIIVFSVVFSLLHVKYLVSLIADSGQAGNWCVSLLKKVCEHTPHNWSAHTLDTFPPLIHEFYAQNHVPADDKQQLQRNAEAEFKRWKCKLARNWLALRPG